MNSESLPEHRNTREMETADERDAMKELYIETPDNITYIKNKVIATGAFGVVYQATVLQTGETVAIKKVHQSSRFRNRELQVIHELDHPNIIEVRHAFFTKENGRTFQNIVMPCIPETLSKIIRHFYQKRQPMPLILVKLYSFQLLKALNYLHSLEITHRDIKPENLLVDTSAHILKLCDFGSAKRLARGESNANYICSRFYRAPELIFGCSEYSSAIDMWSVGCIIAEMILGKPIFNGMSRIDQLVQIIKVLGSPSRELIFEMNPHYQEFRLPFVKPIGFNKVFRKSAPDDAIDLVRQILVYSPCNRITPVQAMSHPFFDNLFYDDPKLPNGKRIPPVWKFRDDELECCSDREKMLRMM